MPPAQPARNRSGAATARRVAVAVLVPVLGVAFLTLFDGDRVESPADLGHVEFGLPFDWVTQDQAIDPTLPYQATPLSPWEHPTIVDGAALAANLLVVLALVVVGRVLLGRMQERRADRAPGPGA